jgi:DNA-binding NarL/FixJ family response regulator
MTRVLIVDDQDIVRQGLGVILSHSQGVEVAGYAADGFEALEQVAALRPDVVLMDLKMPRLNGIQATARITREHPTVRVVVLTTYDADEWLFDAIRAGASGYLLKDSDSQEIVDAVQRAVAGEVRLDPAVAGRVLQEFNRLRGGRPASVGSEDVPQDDTLKLSELTERELAILQELAQGKNNREIAATLYLAEGTVKNYVSVIIEKLQANDRTHAAILALKRGLATLE